MFFKKIMKLGIIVCTFLLLYMECRTEPLSELLGMNPNLTIEKESATIDGQIRIFYGDYTQETLAYEDYKVTGVEEEDLPMLFTYLLKCYPSKDKEYIVGIPNTAIIETLSVDYKKDKVYVEMTKGYEKMNYGTLAEGLALQSLAYTIGNYYDVKEVVISLEGENYASGHFYFENDEGIIVHSQGINKNLEIHKGDSDEVK